MNDQVQKQTILIVDDEPVNIRILLELLQHDYATKIATNGETALQIAQSDKPPDLILLDVMMPGMDGYEVCKRLKQLEATREIPVIFVTAQNEITKEERGFEVGCIDYLTKPISPSLALARVKTHTALSQARRELQEWNTNLKHSVIRTVGMMQEKTQELEGMLEKNSAESALITSYANLLKMIDTHHYTHANNVSMLVTEAAQRMSLDYRTIRDISLAGLLHDIGKLGLAQHIAYRLPGEMSESELKEYQQHSLRSKLILEHVESLQHVVLMIRHHHEAFNGTGFPDGLKGDTIPLGAQLIGIADFIDHETQKASEGHADYALRNLSLRAGTLFNPELIDHFREVIL